MANKIQLTAEYKDTDFTRTYTISDVADSIAAAPANIKTKIKEINASVEAGTSGGLDDFFRADDFDNSDQSNIIGSFVGFSAAKIISEEVVNIDLDSEGDATNG